MATQDDYIRTALRVPPELHAKIHEAAKSNNRTFNAEIVARLDGSLADDTIEVTGFNDQLRAIFEDRIFSLQVEKNYTNANIKHLYEMLEKIQGDVSDTDSLEQTIYTLELTRDQNKYTALSEAIGDVVKAARRHGLTIDPEELMSPNAPKRKPGFQASAPKRVARDKY